MVRRDEARRLLIGAGFESSAIYWRGRDGRIHAIDAFALGQHDTHWREDLKLAYDSGVREIRYPLLWNRIHLAPGRFDWSWMDEVMDYIRELGFTVIADPFHFSCPPWIEDGFLNPAAVDYFLDYLEKAARRYPWVTSWTPVNEPTTLAIMGASLGKWWPWKASDEAFVTMATHLAQAISAGSRLLKELNPENRIVHIDATEHHDTFPEGHPRADAESHEYIRFLNGRRFLIADLALGWVDTNHPMWPYLKRSGFPEKRLSWFHENPAQIDVMGFDCYFNNTEHWWQKEQPGHIVPSPYPNGFADVILQYVDRYAPRMPSLDFKITEFNAPGTYQDRIAGLRFMLAEYHRAEEWLAAHGLERYGREVRLLGVHWFPFIDSVGWWGNDMCSLEPCYGKDGMRYDAIGIIWVSPDGTRHESPLSEVFGQLARGEIGYQDMPTFQFCPDLRRDLASYERFMPESFLEKEAG